MSSYSDRLKDQLSSLRSSSLRLTHNDREVSKVVRQLPWMRQHMEPNVLCSAYRKMIDENAVPELWSALNKLGGAAADEEMNGEMPTADVSGVKWLLLLSLFALVDAVGKPERSSEDAQALLRAGGLPACSYATKLVRESREHANDILDAKIYFAVSRAYTLAGELEELCTTLLVAYRSAVLNKADMCIATLINQLVQAYLMKGDYQSAIQFTKVSKFPEDTIRSTPQIVRCMFNLGRIHALQLNYAEALEHLQSAINKLPPDPRYAFGFKLLCYKYSIVVELLMGDIPSITIFRSPRGRHFRPKLAAYEALVLAVRNGDNSSFQNVVREHSAAFKADGTLYLVERLHHAVQRVALRKINLAFDRISLADIAQLIGVAKVTDAESIVAKAIVDGVIAGHIDAEVQCLVSKSMQDEIGAEAAETFSKRILFCSEMYSDAQRALQYPEEESLKARAADAEERRKLLAEERTRAEEGDVFDEDEY